MSTRSEFYEAVYHDAPSALPIYEIAAAASFGLCAAVFVVAAILAWRKTPAAISHHASLPFHSETLSGEDL